MAASHTVVLYEPTETSPEVTTAAGFLAGARTREVYTLDQRQFIRWCGEHRLGLFDITRTHIELYARQLEDEGKAPATTGRRLSTLASFHRYATDEGVLDHSPAVHVRRPKLAYESHAVGLDRNELGAFLVQAGLSSPHDRGSSPRLPRACSPSTLSGSTLRRCCWSPPETTPNGPAPRQRGRIREGAGQRRCSRPVTWCRPA